MSAAKARKYLEENIKKYISAKSDPAMFNLCQALIALSHEVEEANSRVGALNDQVAQLAALAARQRR